MGNRTERRDGIVKEKCANCGVTLGRGRGYYAIGTQGQFADARLAFCDAQCMWNWDGSGGPGFLGNQGFDLAVDLLRPRR